MLVGYGRILTRGRSAQPLFDALCNGGREHVSDENVGSTLSDRLQLTVVPMYLQACDTRVIWTLDRLDYSPEQFVKIASDFHGPAPTAKQAAHETGTSPAPVHRHPPGRNSAVFLSEPG